MKTVAISASSSGNNTLVAAVTGKRIRVVSYVLSFSGTVNAKFTDGAGGSDLTGLLYGAAGVNVSAAPHSDGRFHGPAGHFETGQGTALVLNLSGATAVGGHLTYDEVN